MYVLDDMCCESMLDICEIKHLQGAQVKLFVRELQLSKRFPTISYVYWDERLTSMVYPLH
jgi:hypothetical protein